MEINSSMLIALFVFIAFAAMIRSIHKASNKHPTNNNIGYHLIAFTVKNNVLLMIFFIGTIAIVQGVVAAGAGDFSGADKAVSTNARTLIHMIIAGVGILLMMMSMVVTPRTIEEGAAGISWLLQLNSLKKSSKPDDLKQYAKLVGNPPTNFRRLFSFVALSIFCFAGGMIFPAMNCFITAKSLGELPYLFYLYKSIVPWEEINKFDVAQLDNFCYPGYNIFTGGTCEGATGMSNNLMINVILLIVDYVLGMCLGLWANVSGITTGLEKGLSIDEKINNRAAAADAATMDTAGLVIEKLMKFLEVKTNFTSQLNGYADIFKKLNNNQQNQLITKMSEFETAIDALDQTRSGQQAKAALVQKVKEFFRNNHPSGGFGVAIVI